VRNVKASISYSHQDADLLDKLHQHLAALRLQGMLSAWTDREILAGGVIDQHIDREFSEAQLYLLLVSAAFLDSKYCYEREFKRALKKFQLGEAIIVPIILRECDWQIPELKQFKALPLDGRPVVSRHWHSVDEAFTDVASGLRKLIEGFPLQNAGRPRREVKPKENFVPNETHITPEQRATLKRICDEIVQRLTVKAATGPQEELQRKTARFFGIVWSQFNEHFGIGQLAELPRERFDEAKTWFLQYRASKDTKFKRANPQKYRNTLLKTIHTLAGKMSWSKDELHAFAAEKVGYATPIPSLSDLGLNQLELVRDRIRYEMSKRRAQSSQKRAVRAVQLSEPSFSGSKELLEMILSHPIQDERGVIEVLYVDGSDPLRAFFFPNARGNGQLLSVAKTTLDRAISELVRLGWLLSLQEKDNIRSYQLNPRAAA
jgi:hypothetical protein